MIDRNVIWEENVKEEGNEKNGEGIRLCIFVIVFRSVEQPKTIRNIQA